MSMAVRVMIHEPVRATKSDSGVLMSGKIKSVQIIDRKSVV